MPLILFINLNEIEALPAPFNRIFYNWNKSGTPVTANSNSANTIYFLTNANYSGNSSISLCLDNGGAQVCETINIDILVNLSKLHVPKLPHVQLQGEFLTWNSNAKIKIWSVEGKLVFEKTGEKGEKIKLSPQLYRIWQQKRHLTKIILM